jgi:hypothetical protein
METYKLQPNNPLTATPLNAVARLSDVAYIPFDPANTDYQQFKKNLQAGAELQDATGTVMTSAQITAFLETLP